MYGRVSTFAPGPSTSDPSRHAPGCDHREDITIAAEMLILDTPEIGLGEITPVKSLASSSTRRIMNISAGSGPPGPSRLGR